MQDAKERKSRIDKDGKIIYMTIAIPNNNKKQVLQGTAMDDPATLARKFAYKHNLGLSN